MSPLPPHYLLPRGAAMMAMALLLGGCVNTTVDEMTYNEPVAGIGESSVVILGRRQDNTALISNCHIAQIY